MLQNKKRGDFASYSAFLLIKQFYQITLISVKISLQTYVLSLHICNATLILHFI